MATWGLSPRQHTDKSLGSTTTYALNDMCSTSKNGSITAQFYFPPGLIHKAHIGPLKPNTSYWYSFGSEVADKTGWSREFRFVSPVAPAVGSRAQLNILAMGDSGTSICQCNS